MNRYRGDGVVAAFEEARGKQDTLPVAVRNLPPLTMSGVRFLAAGVLLYCWCLWQRRRHPEAGWRGGMEMICAGVALCLIGAAGGELGRINAASLISDSGPAAKTSRTRSADSMALGRPAP